MEPTITATARRLQRSFFERPTLEVAKNLLGKLLVYKGGANGVKIGRVNEVEAYIGQDDPACHAACGITPRNTVMFGPAGFSYVYFVYGMYHCLNIVTEKEGFPAAVLIRGVDPVLGIDHVINGPGKLCLAYGLDKQNSGVDLCTNNDFYLQDDGERPKAIKTTSRIGIKMGLDKPWRFLVSK